MMLHNSISDMLRSAERPFNIIEEYAALSPKRKFLLCDHLCFDGEPVFRNTVSLLWPEAEEQDIEKLKKFILLLKSTRLPS